MGKVSGVSDCCHRRADSCWVTPLMSEEPLNSDNREAKSGKISSHTLISAPCMLPYSGEPGYEPVCDWPQAHTSVHRRKTAPWLRWTVCRSAAACLWCVVVICHQDFKPSPRLKLNNGDDRWWVCLTYYHIINKLLTFTHHANGRLLILWLNVKHRLYQWPRQLIWQPLTITKQKMYICHIYSLHYSKHLIKNGYMMIINCMHAYSKRCIHS